MADSAEMAALIAEKGKALDYEQMALDAIERSWTLDDKECIAIAVNDAQVFATLHQARTMRELFGK
jgi:hypothetical protein